LSLPVLRCPSVPRPEAMVDSSLKDVLDFNPRCARLQYRKDWSPKAPHASVPIVDFFWLQGLGPRLRLSRRHHVLLHSSTLSICPSVGPPLWFNTISGPTHAHTRTKARLVRGLSSSADDGPYSTLEQCRIVDGSSIVPSVPPISKSGFF
jgi:hypothetical protein